MLIGAVSQWAAAAGADPDLARLEGRARHSAGGAGRLGEAVLARGDDWWLPEDVGWSRRGSVICGYGEPWGREHNWVCSGQAVWCPWKSLQKEPGTLDADSLDRYLTRYGTCTPPPGKRPKEIQLYIHGTDCGAFAPGFLADPPFDVPTCAELAAENGRIPAKSLGIWTNAWNSTLRWAYPFWHPSYIEQRLAFHTLLARFLAKHPHGHLVRTVDCLGEFATLWMYVRDGFAPPDVVDGAAEPLVRSALDSGIAAEKWLIPMGVGGRPYRAFAEEAARHHMGVGNHGGRGIISFQFAQNLKHLRYDDRLLSYQWTTDRLPYAFFHTDCETLDATPNTFAQYRMFRFWCLAAVSMGVDRLLVTSSTIPSMGREAPGREGRPFRWDQIEKEGALEFVEWMNRTLGRPVGEAPEAYCCLIQSGTPPPEGSSFAQAVSAAAPERAAWGTLPPHAKTPLIAYWGRFCDLDLNVPGGRGAAALQMTADRLGKIWPGFDIWTYGAGVFEGRATRRRQGNPALFFRLADAFIGPERPAAGVVAKVTFANPEGAAGSWRFEYDGVRGWTASPPVAFAPAHGASNATWTATFRLEDARFANGGPEGADFAIRALDGADAAFVHVRIIKDPPPGP